MKEAIYCGYAGCYCLLPCQIEDACSVCDLKNGDFSMQADSDLCPNGLGYCSEKNCQDCSELKYALNRGE